MDAPPGQLPAYRDRVSLPGRATALLLAIGISGLIVIMLLRLGGFASGSADRDAQPIVVSLLAAEKQASKEQEQRRERPPTPRTRIIVPPPPPIALPPPAVKLNMLVMTPEEFAATDISRFPSRSPDPGATADSRASAGDAESVGRGPNGEKLYNAEWYREPTHAEMATYLPQGIAQSSWAMIACRTADRYRVEDCQELTESPPGSGLARALRQAAWQFLVRPPRKGGKPMIGAWVRIRFDFHEEKKG